MAADQRSAGRAQRRPQHPAGGAHGLLAAGQLGAQLTREAVRHAQAFGDAGHGLAVAAAGQAIVFAQRADLGADGAQPRLEQRGADVVGRHDDLLAAQQVAHDGADLALAGDDRQLGQVERPGLQPALQPLAVVDIDVQRGRQRGLAAQCRQREAQEAGLQREIGAPLHATEAQRAAPGTGLADGVAHAQARQPFGVVALPTRLQPHVAAARARQAGGAEVAHRAEEAGLPQRVERAAGAGAAVPLRVVVDERRPDRWLCHARLARAQVQPLPDEGRCRGLDLQRLRGLLDAPAQRAGAGQQHVLLAVDDPRRAAGGQAQVELVPVGLRDGQAVRQPHGAQHGILRHVVDLQRKQQRLTPLGARRLGGGHGGGEQQRQQRDQRRQATATVRGAPHECHSMQRLARLGRSGLAWWRQPPRWWAPAGGTPAAHRGRLTEALPFWATLARASPPSPCRRSSPTFR